MKKVLFTFIIIMSSFFFSSYVDAATLEYTITEEDIGYVSSEDFKIVREKAIEYATENDMYYRISWNKTFSSYWIYFYEKDTFTLKYSSTTITLYPSKTKRYITYSGGIFNAVANSSSNAEKFLAGSKVYYNEFLDTNFDNFIFDYSSKDINFVLTTHYQDTSYSFPHNSTYKSLYEIYIENTEFNDEPVVDYPLVSNFYTLVIEKISLLTSLFIQNPIFLFVFGILILIFLIELIRRYLL